MYNKILIENNTADMFQDEVNFYYLIIFFVSLTTI